MKRRFQIGIALMLGSYLAGAIGYKVLKPEATWLDCVYMSVITVATVGFGEVIESGNNPIVRAYTLMLIMAGSFVTLYAVAVVTAYIVEGDLKEYFWRRRMQRQIESMRGHFIVCGASETSQRIIEELAQTRRDFVVIDSDPQAIAHIRAKHHAAFVEGVPDDAAVLKAAGVERASGVAVALPNDRDNLVTTLSIRMLNPSIRIVSMEIEPGMAARLQRAGADAVVNPGAIGGLRLVSELIRPSVVMFLDTMLRDKDAAYRFEELVITRDCGWAGKKLGEIPTRTEFGLYVVAVRAPGQTNFIYNPDDSWTIQPGQILIVLGSALDVQRARQFLEVRQSTAAN